MIPLAALQRGLRRRATAAVTALLMAGVVAACAAPVNTPQGDESSAATPAPPSQASAPPAPAPQTSSAPAPAPVAATPAAPASARPAPHAPAPATPVSQGATPPSGAPGRDVAPPAGSQPATPVKIDTTCRTHADCTVKNVGNCCGYAPACVNVNSPTDPQGVQAECARTGQMSVCGFREITACQCVKGQCEPAAGGLDVQ